MPKSSVQGWQSMGWHVSPRLMRNHQVTVHGLDIGIHADMTVFCSLPALVCNEQLVAWERAEYLSFHEIFLIQRFHL